VSGLSVDGGVRFEKGLSPSRVIQTYQVLNMVLKYAIRAKRLVVNPAADVELPPIGDPEKLYLSHQQVQELAVASGRFRTLVLVLSYCGLRFGEATALRRKNIDLKQARIWVRASATHVARQGIIESDTKTHEDRKVPIPASVVELLRTELPKDPEALAFPGRKGGYLPLGEFRWTFDQAVTALQSAAAAKRQEEIEETGEAVTPEFPVITPHELRHTCASLAIKAGANIKVLQNLLGHKTATLTLDRYGHLYPDELGVIADALDDGARAAAASLRPQPSSEGWPNLQVVP
jgi:integrase